MELLRIMMTVTMIKTSWWLLLLIICACVNSFSLRPLNERSTELNWQAWLLIDQNNRQTDLGILRRRITPKSVFIAPTFSPDTLPACAEGYRSDSMGRCVKIIRINEAAHLDFLLERLNEQFGDYVDEETEDSDVPTSGPFQFNIPLSGDNENSNEENDYDNDTDMAIVVAPTTSSSVKLDVKRNDGDKFNLNNIAAILGVKPEDLETTTISDIVSTTTTTSATLQTTTELPNTRTTLQDITETTISETFPATSATEKLLVSRTEEQTQTATSLPEKTVTTATVSSENTDNSNSETSTMVVEEDALFFRWRF